MDKNNTTLLSGRVETIFRSTGINSAFNCLGAVVAVGFAWNDLTIGTPIGFALALIAVYVSRAFVARRYWRDPLRVERAQYYGRIIILLNLMLGSSWCVFTFLAVSAASGTIQTTVIGLTASSIAFGGIINAVLWKAYFSISLPVLFGIIAGLVARGDEFGLTFGPLVLLLVPAEIAIAHAVAKMMIESLRLRIENQSLVDGLIVARERAEAGDRAKTQFLAVMSHEIRTPMTAILGLSEVAIDRATDPQQLRELELVRESGQSLLGLLNDILDLSRLEADKVEFDIQVFDVGQTVQSVVTLMTSRAAEKQLDLTLSMMLEPPTFVRGDSGRLRQVLVNLIANGIKFTKAGSVTVTVESAQADDTSIRLKISVTDTGVGIAPDVQARIFESFVQADSSISRHYGGTGLGLAICRNLVERQGGTIGVRSQPGVGSTFWFELDYERANRMDMSPAQDAPSVSGRAYRILVVEDNEVNQILARTILERDGHQVTIAENGREAVTAATDQMFDLVLMDLQMPEMDGLEAARLIRATAGSIAQVPIVALTAAASASEVAACFAAGMNGVLAKPYRAQDLADAIAQHVGR